MEMTNVQLLMSTNNPINNLKIETATKKEFLLCSFFSQNQQPFSDAVVNSIPLLPNIRGEGGFAKIKLEN